MRVLRAVTFANLVALPNSFVPETRVIENKSESVLLLVADMISEVNGPGKSAAAADDNSSLYRLGGLIANDTYCVPIE